MIKTLMLPFLAWAGRLRYPTLFKLTAGLFLVTLLLPDPVLLLDEIVLGMATLLLARWKTRRDPAVENNPLPPLTIDGTVIHPTSKS